jgi:hypothetical protein
VVGAFGCVVALVGWAGVTRRNTLGADLSLAVGVAVVLLGRFVLRGRRAAPGSWLAGRSELLVARTPAVGFPWRRAWPWVVVAVLTLGWELLAIDTAPGRLHLTLTALAGRFPVFRALLFAAWLGLGAVAAWV